MDILSRSEAETFLEIESGSGGDFLQQLIADVSAMLAVATGRVAWGPSTERTELHDGGRPFIAPYYFPVDSVVLYEDDEYDFDDATDAEDYHADTHGFIWRDTDVFLDGSEVVKIVYTGGYANAAAIPDPIKTAAKRQLEYEYNLRRRTGGQRDDVKTGQVLPELTQLLSPYNRSIPFTDGH